MITGLWNYVATALKPTSVTHSCSGNFTGPSDRNLILAKCTWIEIHLLYHGQDLRLLLDVPIKRRVTSLGLFRPPGEAQDLLFIAIEGFEFCVLQWDTKTSTLITREKRDFSDPTSCPTDNVQTVIIEPDGHLIGCHLYNGLFKVIPFGDEGKLLEPFDIRLGELQVLDIKFLLGCTLPTLAILYKDSQYRRCYLKTIEVMMGDKLSREGQWSRNIFNNGANFLIPVPSPVRGVLIIGEDTISYYSATAFTEISISTSITRAYAMVSLAEGSILMVLGDHAGLLNLLVITHEKEKVTGLAIGEVGITSVASTISYLGDESLFVGSSCGDSQLVKLHLNQDPTFSRLEVLEKYANLGPIDDLCVLDMHRQCQGEVVTCSGAYKSRSLRRVWIETKPIIKEQASLDLVGIKGLWSLKAASGNTHDTLVVSTVKDTLIFVMNGYELEELKDYSEMEGFLSEVQTLFCHDAVYDQIVQVTERSVRLVSAATRQLVHEWNPPKERLISVATANSTQVLLGCICDLIYLEITNGLLQKVREIKLEHPISCIDINPLGKGIIRGNLAAVGTTIDYSVSIYSIPSLECIAKEEFRELPRSVLLCSLKGISYLLCGLGDGLLFNFLVNTSTGELTDRKEASVGTRPFTLRAFSLKNTTHVFTASDSPAVLYGSGRKLLSVEVNLEEVYQMCPFNSVLFPDGFVMAKEGKLVVATIDGMGKPYIDSIPLEGQYARRICHQAETGTFAICSVKYMQSDAGEAELHSITLLNDQSFDLLSSIQLDKNEHASSIVSCSFYGDQDVYYCIGTGYFMPEQTEATKGRIRVYGVKKGKLELIDKLKTKGAVHSLNAFKGGLLAAINNKIELYGTYKHADSDNHGDDDDFNGDHYQGDYDNDDDYNGDHYQGDYNNDGVEYRQDDYDDDVVEYYGGYYDSARHGVQKYEEVPPRNPDYNSDDDSRLVCECGYQVHSLARSIQTCGDYILVGDLMKSIALLIYKGDNEGGGTIEEVARDYKAAKWMSAVEILDGDIFLGGESNYNLFKFERNSGNGRSLEVVGHYHLGEYVTCFRHGSLVMHPPLQSEVSNIPTVLFGTVNGSIGVIASLPEEQYVLLEKLQSSLSKLINGVGGIAHAEATKFLDGDFIESFLDLETVQMEAISAEIGCLSVEQLIEKVDLLKLLHY